VRRSPQFDWNDAACSGMSPYLCAIESGPMRAVVCDGHPATLKCPRGDQSLNIMDATYGRSREAPYCPYTGACFACE